MMRGGLYRAVAHAGETYFAQRRGLDVAHALANERYPVSLATAQLVRPGSPVRPQSPNRPAHCRVMLIARRRKRDVNASVIVWPSALSVPTNGNDPSPVPARRSSWVPLTVVPSNRSVLS